MARRIPYVADGTLHVLEPSDGLKMAVGSPSWIAWLTDPATRSFSFESASATYTARKESRSRGGEYWTAYRRHNGRLRKAYLGKAEDLTLDRLDGAAATLAARGNESTASSPPDASGGAAAPTTKGSTATEDQGRERSPRGRHGDPLLSTKLSVPSGRPSLVSRVRLIEKLEEGLACRLTLASAPAGFGKSTLLGAWVSGLSGGRPVAWLSLDPGDNDPARFWRYFITAVDRLQPGAGESALALLGSPQGPPIEALLTTLLNEIAGLSSDAVLVLDDYHLIESREIHAAMTFLLDQLPPRMHLVVCTRADPQLPLARLRARGEMAELRATDLSFTPEEAATFLNQVMGLELSAEDIAELEERTEGWIAGLQLAALAMRDHADVPGFISAFTGSNRHVVDYLAEEVLGRQPEHLRAFLLRTSVLDRMCAPLCDALTQRGEDEHVGGLPDGQAMLERLEHDNLFVVPLDEDRRWYRYHHLFADVLRQRLRQTRPDLPVGLHYRASTWFEQQGLASEAVRHALASKDAERAAALIEESGMPFALAGNVHTVLAWVDALPQALVLARPILCAVHAMALMFANRLEYAEARLRDAERSLGTNPLDEQALIVLGQVGILRASIMRYRGDLAGCVALASKTLDLLPDTESAARDRTAAAANVALICFVNGDAASTSERDLTAAVEYFRAFGEKLPLLICILFLARLRTLRGRLGAAADTYEEARRVVSGREEVGELVSSAAYYVGLGDLYRERNDLEAAERHLTRGLDLARGTLVVDADVVAQGYLSLARLQQTRGRHSDAITTLDTFADLARRRDYFPLLRARSDAVRARIALMQDDLQTAILWAEANGFDVGNEIDYLREEEHLTLARVLIARGRSDPSDRCLDDATRLLGRLKRSAEDGGRTGSEIEILALLALSLHARGETDRALAALEQALALATPEGYVRVFIDEGQPMAVLLRELLKMGRAKPRNLQPSIPLAYARRLLAAFEPPHAGAETPANYLPEDDGTLSEPLTPRELEVLGLIAAGSSNAEIAATLFIAVGTVKWYVNTIFRKLEVDSRTRAVARARELLLVSE